MTRAQAVAAPGRSNIRVHWKRTDTQLITSVSFVTFLRGMLQCLRN
jgi:hypothetical protein